MRRVEALVSHSGLSPPSGYCGLDLFESVASSVAASSDLQEVCLEFCPEDLNASVKVVFPPPPIGGDVLTGTGVSHRYIMCSAT